MSHVHQTASGRNSPVVCATCERSVPRKARQQIYCSTKCRERGKTAAGALKKQARYPDSGAPPDPPKSTSDFNSLQAPKQGSSLFSNAPLNLFGGSRWRWPNTPQLDGKLIRKILYAELGGVPIDAHEDAAARFNANDPEKATG